MSVLNFHQIVYSKMHYNIRQGDNIKSLCDVDIMHADIPGKISEKNTNLERLV